MYMQVFHASVVTEEQQLLSGALKVCKRAAGKAMLHNELKVRAALQDAPHMPRVLAWAADATPGTVEAVLFEAFDGTLQERIDERLSHIKDENLPNWQA